MATIQNSAKSYRLEVIPLIQTFGHLEWLLKLREYELYRDDLSLPMVITPCFNATYVLLEGTMTSEPSHSTPLLLLLLRSSATDARHASK